MSDNTQPLEMRVKEEKAGKGGWFKLATKKLAKGIKKAIISHPAVRNVGEVVLM